MDSTGYGGLDEGLSEHKQPTLENMEGMFSIGSTEVAAKQREKRDRDEAEVEQHEAATEPDAVEEEREAVLDQEEAQQGGSHGGSSASKPSDGGSPASGPEAAPQRDEPDDDHQSADTDEAEKAAEIPQVAVAKPDSEQQLIVASDPEPVETPASAPPEPSSYEPGKSPSKHNTVPTLVHSNVKSHEGEFEANRSAGLQYDDGDLTSLRSFPKELLEKLRLALAAVTGEKFSKEVSYPSLVIGFVIAGLGDTTQVDENTAQVAQGFRLLNPFQATIEERQNEILGDISKISKAIESLRDYTRDTRKTVDGIELSQAYLVADRVGFLSTEGVTESTVDVTQPKVIKARDNIRKRVKEQRAIDERRDGRRRN